MTSITQCFVKRRLTSAPPPAAGKSESGGTFLFRSATPLLWLANAQPSGKAAPEPPFKGHSPLQPQCQMNLDQAFRRYELIVRRNKVAGISQEGV